MCFSKRRKEGNPYIRGGEAPLAVSRPGYPAGWNGVKRSDGYGNDFGQQPNARGVDASIPNESLAPVRRASSAMSNEKNWIIQSRSGVCPLDIRDHIPVRRLRNYNHQPVFLPRRLPVGCLQLREEQFNCGRSIAP